MRLIQPQPLPSGSNLSFLGKDDLGATGNLTHGYFVGGGLDDPEGSKVDKITYSSDTTAAVPGVHHG